MESSLFWWKLADFGLDVFHSVFILFIVFGWVFYKARKAHLIALISVLLSWIGLGYWYGWGYCILTDYHWAIKKHLGENELPSSFIAYAYEKIFGVLLSDATVEVLAYGLLILSIVMSLTLNFRDKCKSKSFRFCKKEQLGS